MIIGRWFFYRITGLLMKRPSKSKARKSLKSAKIKTGGPKEYNGILYKNALEARMAEALTEARLPVNYETWKVILYEKIVSQVESWEPKTKKNKETNISLRTFAPVSTNLRTAVYTPDFVCLEQGWVIETKGLRTEAFNARYRAFKQWLHHNGYHHFRLYMPGNHTEIQQTVTHILACNASNTLKQAA